MVTMPEDNGWEVLRDSIIRLVETTTADLLQQQTLKLSIFHAALEEQRNLCKALLGRVRELEDAVVAARSTDETLPFLEV